MKSLHVKVSVHTQRENAKADSKKHTVINYLWIFIDLESKEYVECMRSMAMKKRMPVAEGWWHQRRDGNEDHSNDGTT